MGVEVIRSESELPRSLLTKRPFLTCKGGERTHCGYGKAFEFYL